jgi:esterase/lipase
MLSSVNYINFPLYFDLVERDTLLERLEKRLAEKEKELEELRKMLSSNTIEELKREIIKELEEKYNLKSLEAKIVELSKAIENIMSDILYIKSELKTSQSKKRNLVEIKEPEELESKEDQGEGELIIVD